MSKIRKIAVFGAITAGALGVGVAFAAWTATGSGSGYVKARTAEALTTVDASATIAGSLYPGDVSDVYVRVTNPNPYGVDVTSITDTGPITSNAGAACDASTGVTFTDATSSTWHLDPGATSTLTLSDAAAMSNASDNSCQGATFYIPVALSGVSAP